MAQAAVGLCFTWCSFEVTHALQSKVFQVFISRIRWGLNLGIVDFLKPDVSEISRVPSGTMVLDAVGCALLLFAHPFGALCLVCVLISFSLAAGCFLRVIQLTQCPFWAIASVSKGEKKYI